MSSPRRIAALAALSALSLLGCGDSRLKAKGSIDLQVLQLGQAPGATGFTFGSEPVVLEGAITGTCRVSGTRADVRLERVGGTSGGLRVAQLTVFATNPTGTEAPSATFVIDTATFASGGSSCTGTGTIASDGDLRTVTIDLSCAGLRAASDARTVGGTVRLELTNCTVQ